MRKEEFITWFFQSKPYWPTPEQIYNKLMGQELETPNKKKPFIVANVREMIDELSSDKISFSAMVEKMNDTCLKWMNKIDIVNEEKPLFKCDNEERGRERCSSRCKECQRNYLWF